MFIQSMMYSRLGQDFKKTPLVALWALSVALEPFNYFIFLDRLQIGANLNAARIFQVIFSFYFLAVFLAGRRVTVSLRAANILTPMIIFVSYNIFLLLIYYNFGTYRYVQFFQVDDTFQNVAGLMRRPIIELINLVYQFFYFIVFPAVLLRERHHFEITFRLFFLMFSLHLLIGWIDYAFQVFNADLVGRHFNDGREVGLRFHGLAGEPRDAASIMLGVPFLWYLWRMFEGTTVKNLDYRPYIVLFSSCVATASASFVVALLIFTILLAMFAFLSINIRIIALTAFYILVLLCGAYFIPYLSPRISLYLDAYISNFVSVFFNPSQDLPYLIKVTFNNVYPLSRLFYDVSIGNVWFLFFGYGIGSSGVANYYIYSEYLNPNSQLIRFLFENGLIGLVLWVFALYRIVRELSHGSSRADKRHLWIVFMLAMAGYLAHRANFLPILIGLSLALAIFKRKAQ